MGRRPRPSSAPRQSNWIACRKAVQYLSLLIFLALFVWSRRGGWQGALVNFPMRLDPLAMLVSALASRTLLISSALALVTVALTLLAGRAWCGWLCPLGTVLDVLGRPPFKVSRQYRPASWRRVKYGLLLTMLAAALLANLTLMIFDPLTLSFRALAASIWPAIDQFVTTVEAILYRLPALRSAVSVVDSILRPQILPPAPAHYRHGWLYAMALAAVVCLNVLAPRFWCRYLCPLGALLGLLSKASILRREVNAQCKQCGACARVCPTATIAVTEQYASDPSECTMCLDCLPVCPYGAIDFPAHLSQAQWRQYNPDRRQAILAIGGAAAAITVLGSDLLAVRDHSRLIRPPGVRENDLLSRCVRCAQCSRACPTTAIQPAITEAGFGGIWTPVIVPRSGYCDYSCNACGQICPVEAIPRLNLQQKRTQVMGKASIDKSRCIAWADERPCGVCEEMCPVPDKAIKFVEIKVQSRDGQQIVVQRPQVVSDRCIGCGTCEYMCPAKGEAAIRVYVPNG